MIMDKLFGKVFDKLKTSSVDTKKIEKKLDKEKEITIDRMNSKRYFSKGSKGNFSDSDGKISLDEYDGEVEADIPSTAISQVKYDPATKVCWVMYVGGNKWYKFENMSPQQFKSFMNASSKGRYVNNVMRVKNRAKGY